MPTHGSGKINSDSWVQVLIRERFKYEKWILRLVRASKYFLVPSWKRDRTEGVRAELADYLLQQSVGVTQSATKNKISSLVWLAVNPKLTAASFKYLFWNKQEDSKTLELHIVYYIKLCPMDLVCTGNLDSCDCTDLLLKQGVLQCTLLQFSLIPSILPHLPKRFGIWWEGGIIL